MTRIDDENPMDRDMIRSTFGHYPTCKDCKELATIWIRLYMADSKDDNLFLCDAHAFHLARILLQDIGHVKRIVQPRPGEPIGP